MRFHPLSPRIIAIMVLALALAACGGDDGTGPSVTVARVDVTPGRDSLTALGQTRQFQAVARNAAGDVVSGKSFSWSSSAANVASVDAASGTATAMGNGSATITATTDGVSGAATLVVRQAVASVDVTAPLDTLKALGSTAALTGTAKDSRDNPIAGRTLTWSSSNDAVIQVSQQGVATAIANGSADISAVADGVSGSKALHVKQTGSALVLTTQPAGAAAGQPLTTQPVLEIRDANGNVLAEDDATVVSATIASGGGTLLGTPTATAAAGVVTFTDLAIGGTVGARTLGFSAPNLTSATSSAFPLDPGPVSQMALQAGDGQTALAATELPDSLAVKVMDEYGNGIAGIDVSWSVVAGTGTLGSPTSASDAAGIARNSYTLGAHAGNDTVQAVRTGLAGSPVRFAVTATPNATIAGTVTVTNAATMPGATLAAQDQGPAGRASRRTANDKLGWPADMRSSSPTSTSSSALEQRPRHTPDELIVIFQPAAVGAPPIGSLAAAFPATARQVGATMRSRLTSSAAAPLMRVEGVSPAIVAARVRVADPARIDDVAAQLRRTSGVARVQRNGIAYLHRVEPPLAAAAPSPSNDPYYEFQAWHYAMIDMPQAWTMTTGDPSVLVAVVDDGIRFDHPDIAGNLTSDGYDFVNNGTTYPICSGGSVGHAADGDGYDPDPTNPADWIYDPVGGCLSGLNDNGNHGLHVAGTIGAVGDNGMGFTGVNWDVAIRPVRVCGVLGCAHYDIAQGVLYAAGLPADDGAGGTVQAGSGASVINMSLGGPHSTTMENAIIAATNAGSLIIASAGNDASSTPNYPAAYSQTVSVSAVGPDSLLASYSSYGSTVDIAAPGGDFADGAGSFGVWSTAWDYVSGVPIYGGWQGTSMAAPHVSGVAALLLAADPSLSASQLRSRLTTYAVDYGVPGRDDFYGYGILNARNSLTQSLAPPQDLYARLYDAASGALVDEVAAGTGGDYAFDQLPDGDYFVFAGQDENFDGVIGLPGRRWGGYSVPSAPSPVTVDGAGTYGGVDFLAGYPWELEPNGDMSSASFLPVGGWLRGYLNADADYLKVVIPASGQYTFETFAQDGACGFALEEDTILELRDENGALLASNDDIDLGGYDWCSRITTNLTTGTYYLVVTGYIGGRYHVQARQGS